MFGFAHVGTDTLARPSPSAARQPLVARVARSRDCRDRHRHPIWRLAPEV